MKKVIIPLVVILSVSSLAFFFYKQNESQLNQRRSVTEQVRQKGKPPALKDIPKEHQELLDWIPDSPRSVNAGGVDIAISFARDISDELSYAIVHDLNLVYSHLESHEYLDSSRVPKVEVNGESKPVEKIIMYTGRGEFFPDEHLGKIGYIVGNEMMIPAELIDDYEEAWNRKIENEAVYHGLLKS